jgi:hypothetical protein
MSIRKSMVLLLPVAKSTLARVPANHIPKRRIRVKAELANTVLARKTVLARASPDPRPVLANLAP